MTCICRQAKPSKTSLLLNILESQGDKNRPNRELALCFAWSQNSSLTFRRSTPCTNIYPDNKVLSVYEIHGFCRI